MGYARSQLAACRMASLRELVHTARTQVVVEYRHADCDDHGCTGIFSDQQQETGYRGQADRFSRVIVEQLVRISGEPLMAADTLALQILLQRHVQSPLILGAALRR